MQGLFPLLAIALVLPAQAQPPANLGLYIGSVPNPNDVVVPISKAFSDSYADLRKAHDKVKPPGVVLVDDPTHADAILTVTYRGDVDKGSSVSTSAPISLGSSIHGTQAITPTLRARITVRAGLGGADFSGVDADVDRTKWSTQAERIYKQAVEWLDAHRDQLIKLRQP